MLSDFSNDKASANHTLNFVNVRGAGDGTKTIAERALAALKTNSDPQAEAFDYDELSTGKVTPLTSFSNSAGLSSNSWLPSAS